MDNKKFIDKYLEFKKDCIEKGMWKLREITRMFKIKLEYEEGK